MQKESLYNPKSDVEKGDSWEKAKKILPNRWKRYKKNSLFGIIIFDTEIWRNSYEISSLELYNWIN